MRAAAAAGGGSWWHHVVEDFTARDITRASDRLPALSGLAAAFGRGGGGRYLAGIWCDMLSVSLQWRVVARRGGGRGAGGLESGRHATYYAPSFSWASVTGRVEFQEPVGSFRTLFHVPCCKGAATTPIGSNAFGPVSSGPISLLARVADVEITEEEADKDSTFSVVPRDGAHIKDVSGIVYPDVLPATEITGQSAFRLFFMGVTTGMEKHSPIALLLKPAGLHRKGCFTRVGLVECSAWLSGWELFARKELVSII